MAPPPKPPVAALPPPVAPPAHKPTHDNQSAFSHSSSGKSSQKHHVKFQPPAPKTSAPPRAPIPPKGSNHHKAVEATKQPFPQVQIGGKFDGGSGFIRVSGGLQTTRYHNYEGLIPTRDLLHADPAQQTTLISAMLAAQLGVNVSTQAQHSQGVEASKRIRSNGSLVTQPRPLPPPTQAPAPAPAPALTSANLEKASKSSLSTSFALTSVSRCPPPGTEKPGTTAMSVKTSKTYKLRCCNCGRSKKSDIENVRTTASGVPLCWQCLAQFEGSDGVREWLART